MTPLCHRSRIQHLQHRRGHWKDPSLSPPQKAGTKSAVVGLQTKQVDALVSLLYKFTEIKVISSYTSTGNGSAKKETKNAMEGKSIALFRVLPVCLGTVFIH